jgi:hypothetical protein
MSKIDRHSDFTPSPSAQEHRFLTRALGCGVEELVEQLGTRNAIKRVETELRRARRARSRKLHAFWSAVLVRIETETDERRNMKPARRARGIWPRRLTRGRRIKRARVRGWGGRLSDPYPLGASAADHAPVAESAFFSIP